MRINGIDYPAGTDVAVLRTAVTALPSCFPDYYPVYPGATRSAPLDVQAEQTASVAAHMAGNYDTAITHLNTAMEKMERSGDDNRLPRMNIEWCMGDTLTAQGKLPEASGHYIKAATHAAKIGDNNPYVESLSQKIVDNAYAQGTQDQTRQRFAAQLEYAVGARTHGGYDQAAEITARKYLAVDAERRGDLEISVEHRAEVRKLQQGPLVMGTETVDERGVATSKDTPLGTSNIEQCTVIVARRPDGVAMMAHVNIYTAPESIRDTLNGFSGGTPLSIRLVGSRENAGAPTSDENLNKVMAVLKERDDFTVASCDTWRSPQVPTAIIYDPKTDKLTHGVPERQANSTIREGIRIITPIVPGGKLPLIASHDSTSIIPDTPIKLEAGTITSLQFYAGADLDKSATQIHTECRDRHIAYPGNTRQTEEWYASITSGILAVQKENARQTDILMAEIKDRLSKEGIDLTPQEERDHRRELLTKEKFLGQNAHFDNGPVIEAEIQRIKQDPNIQHTIALVDQVQDKAVANGPISAIDRPTVMRHLLREDKTGGPVAEAALVKRERDDQVLSTLVSPLVGALARTGATFTSGAEEIRQPATAVAARPKVADPIGK